MLVWVGIGFATPSSPARCSTALSISTASGRHRAMADREALGARPPLTVHRGSLVVRPTFTAEALLSLPSPCARLRRTGGRQPKHSRVAVQRTVETPQQPA